MFNKKYAFCGTHGTGKSTLLTHIEDILKWHQIEIVNDSSNARKLKSLGYKINEEGNDFVEYVVASSHVSNFARTNHWFADRCIIDGTAYMFETKCTKKCKQAIVNMCKEFSQHYTQIFYIPIEFDMQSDGVRRVDEIYRKKIDTNMKELLENLNNVTIVTGDLTQRRNIIQSYLEK